MSNSLLLYSHDFYTNEKKLFKAEDVHKIDINAELLNKSSHKNYKVMSEIVKYLFAGYDKLTLITNFMPRSDLEYDFSGRSLIFLVNSNGLKDMYELNDFHTAVMSHLASYQLLVESQEFLKKELVTSELSKVTSNHKTLAALLNDYNTVISRSKSVLDTYREDVVLKFGATKLLRIKH